MHFTRSRQGHLAGIFGMLALFGAGCGSNNKSGSGDAYASFAWSIYDIQDSTRLRSCAEVGAASVVVTLMNQRTGDVYTQNPVSCSGSNMEMSTAYVPADNYTVGFDLYGDPAIYGNATTLLDSFDLADGYGTTVVLPLYAGLNDFRGSVAPFVTQSFIVGWGIYYQGVPTTCSSVYAAGVDLDFAILGSSTWVTSPFDCVTGAGTSYAIPYDPTTQQRPTSAQWKLYLVDSTGQDIASLAGASVFVPTNTDINLGSQYFSF
jgi:hypothetical protein